MKIVAIILTFNEAKHIKRCIDSISSTVDKIYVIDSFSTDNTKNISIDSGAIFLCNKFINHSLQFNWALNQLDKDTDWVLRIDADEYLTPELAYEIKHKVAKLDHLINGVYLSRRIIFLGKLLRYGGIFPNKVIRLFKYGYGQCDYRWMDERIKVEGKVTFFKNNLIDKNLNSLSWWIQKHNNYSSKEVLEMLNAKYNIIKGDKIFSLEKCNYRALKFNKRQLYNLLPIFSRSFTYFIYRYFLRLGFLDGYEGLAFHFLQGLWYRFLTDLKYKQVCDEIESSNKEPIEVINQLLNINIKSINNN